MFSVPWVRTIANTAAARPKGTVAKKLKAGKLTKSCSNEGALNPVPTLPFNLVAVSDTSNAGATR